MQYVDDKPAFLDSYSHNECGASGHEAPDSHVSVTGRDG